MVNRHVKRCLTSQVSRDPNLEELSLHTCQKMAIIKKYHKYPMSMWRKGNTLLVRMEIGAVTGENSMLLFSH